MIIIVTGKTHFTFLQVSTREKKTGADRISIAIAIEIKKELFTNTEKFHACRIRSLLQLESLIEYLLVSRE